MSDEKRFHDFEVWIDGVRPKGVTEVTVHTKVGEADTVTITFVAASINRDDPEPSA